MLGNQQLTAPKKSEYPVINNRNRRELINDLKCEAVEDVVLHIFK